jgi:hypothetical protein
MGDGRRTAAGGLLVLWSAMCVECHSPRDESGAIIPGKEFTGAPIPFRPPALSGSTSKTIPSVSEQSKAHAASPAPPRATI